MWTLLSILAVSSLAAAQSPMVFERNLGQAPPEARYIARAGTQVLLFEENGSLIAPDASIRFAGARPKPDVESAEPARARVNYLIGPPERWRTNVSTYTRIRYRNLYKGVDVVWYGAGQHLEYDLILDAGVDPSIIAMDIPGVTVDRSGELVAGSLRLRRPVAYQGSKRIGARYTLDGSRVRFKLDEWDRSKPLVIDPVVVYATYLGGSADDGGSAVAVDRHGYMYIAGFSRSTDFPVSPGVFQVKQSGGNCFSGRLPIACADVFAAKLTPSGDELIYATYIGGQADDFPSAIVVDGSGNLYIAGATGSPDFPQVNPLFQEGRSFLLKLNTDGSALVYATRVGPAAAQVTAIAVDLPGNLYFAGSAGGGFPIVNSPHKYHLGSPLFRTRDQGVTWQPVYAGLRAGVSQVVFAPGDASVIYASGGGAVRRSSDGGVTWNLRTPANGVDVIAVDPGNSSVLYAAGQSGVSKSTDGGLTWRAVNQGMANLPRIQSLAIDPRNTSIVYAGAVDGVWKTEDGGGLWRPTALYWGVADANDTARRVTSLAIDPKTPSILYAGTESGIYRSDDAGASWRQRNNGLSGQVFRLAIDPLTPSTLYAITLDTTWRLWKTTNGGETWASSMTGLPSTALNEVAVNPARPTQIALTGGLEIYLSDDGAATWRAIGNQLPSSGTETIAFDPATGAVYAGLYDSSEDDALVGKLNSAGTALVYSAQIGGSGSDSASSIAVDADGRVRITGATDSPDLAVGNAAQRRKGGGADGFLTVLSPDGATIETSTYLGGAGQDCGIAVAAGPDRSTVLLGFAEPPSGSPNTGYYLARFDAAGALQSSVPLESPDNPVLAVRPDGVALVAGGAAGLQFPARCETTSNSAQGVAVRVTPSGQTECFQLPNAAQAIAVDPNGVLIAAGTTASNAMPLVNPLQSGFNGGTDATIVRLADIPASLPVSLDAVVDAAGYGSTVAPGEIVTLFGSGLTYGAASAESVPLPRALVDMHVTFNGVPATLYFASATQINAQVPFEIGVGTATVVVEFGGKRASRNVDVAESAPAVFALNSRGSGPGAILHASDYSVVGTDNPAAPGEVVLVYATGLGKLEAIVPTGAAPPDPAPRSQVTPEVRVGGRLAEVLWSGAAPGFAGLNQINVRLPLDLPSGEQSLQVASGNRVTIAIR